MCSDGMSGPQFQIWDHKKQAAFMITHRHCDLNVIDEFEQDESCEHYSNLEQGSWKYHLRCEL